MGRSPRIALGAIVAALAATEMAPRHLVGAAAFGLATLLLLHERRPGRWALVAPIVLGAVLISLRVGIAPLGPSAPIGIPEGEGPWSLVVTSTGSPRDGEQLATLSTPPSYEPAFQVAASLPRYPVIVPGDRVVVDGAIRPPPDSPYGEYLRRIGAVGTLRSRSLELEPASDDPGRRLEGLRRTAAEALALVLPEPEAGLAAGILIGLRDLVDRDLAAAFTTAGVSHVVAISGWNIAIVAAAVAAATGRLGRRRRSVVTVAAIVAYIAFAGASASVVRAGLMAGVVLLARETGRAGRATAALGWAATLLLAVDPGLVLDAGFQLSSLATAGLIAWGTPLGDRIHAVGRGRIPRSISEGLGVSLAAQAATLPIILVSFGRLAILSPIVNLLVVPLVAPAMAAGVAALIGGAIVLAGAPNAVGAVLAAPAWVLLRILVTIVEGAAAVPFASVTLTAPFDVVASAGVAVGVLLIARHGRGRARAPVASPTLPRSARAAEPASPGHRRIVRASGLALVIATLVAGGVFAARPAQVPRVSILDVGQGDAVLVEGSRGGRLLIDGGPDPDRLLVDLDHRVPPWDRRIDAVILTHPHEDHVAGLALLLDRYRVGRVFEPGMVGPGPGYVEWSRRLAGLVSIHRGGLAAGDRLAVDEIRFDVLWPIRGQVPATPPDGGTGINNVSIVLLGQVGDRRMLLMGDVEEGIDPSLLRDHLPRVDLLKVAHHGSRTATTQGFVDAVRPKVAVASAGAGNPYGHPAKATLDRLAAAGARVLRTDRDGTVVVAFEPDEVSVRAEGGRGAAEATTARLAVARTGAGRSVASPATAFRCAIPVTGLIPELDQRPAARPRPAAIDDREPHRPAKAGTVAGHRPECDRDRAPVVRRWARRGASAGRIRRPRTIATSPGSRPAGGRAGTVGYHRADDRARAGGGRLPAPLPPSARLAGSARPRRRRGRRLAGGTDRGQRDRGGPTPRRGCRPPPRRRQDPAARRSTEGAPARRRLGRVADAVRSP
jgi:competence protein ComEC